MGAESILQGSWRLNYSSPDRPLLTPKRRLAAGRGGADATTLALLVDSGWSQRPDSSPLLPHLQHNKAVRGQQFDATLFTGPIRQIFPISGNKPATLQLCSCTLWLAVQATILQSAWPPRPSPDSLVVGCKGK